MYGCGKCGTLKFVPFRCHSRFCPTCGTKYSIDRTTSMSFKIINVQHRHCVFTIDSELRHFFLEDRELLGLLFEAVQSVILRMFHKDNKTEKFTPGFRGNERHRDCGAVRYVEKHDTVQADKLF